MLCQSQVSFSCGWVGGSCTCKLLFCFCLCYLFLFLFLHGAVGITRWLASRRERPRCPQTERHFTQLSAFQGSCVAVTAEEVHDRMEFAVNSTGSPEPWATLSVPGAFLPGRRDTQSCCRGPGCSCHWMEGPSVLRTRSLPKGCPQPSRGMI